MPLASIRRSGAIVALVVVAASLAACGGAASTSAPTVAAPAASVDAAPTDPGQATQAAGDCAGGAAAAITKAIPAGQSGTVTIDGGCHQAVITTALADADVSTARDLCDAAAAVGYIDGVSSILVIGASGKELAAGLSTMACIAEP